jgi:hypothetical protein
LAYDSDDSVDSPDPLHPEDWQDWYSEQLLDAWMTIRQWAEDDYIVLRMGYPDFVQFVMDPENFYSEEEPAIFVNIMWNQIKDIQVIRENITRENFAGWINLCVDINED